MANIFSGIGTMAAQALAEAAKSAGQPARAPVKKGKAKPAQAKAAQQLQTQAAADSVGPEGARSLNKATIASVIADGGGKIRMPDGSWSFFDERGNVEENVKPPSDFERVATSRGRQGFDAAMERGNPILTLLEGSSAANPFANIDPGFGAVPEPTLGEAVEDAVSGSAIGELGRAGGLAFNATKGFLDGQAEQVADVVAFNLGGEERRQLAAQKIAADRGFTGRLGAELSFLRPDEAVALNEELKGIDRDEQGVLEELGREVAFSPTAQTVGGETLAAPAMNLAGRAIAAGASKLPAIPLTKSGQAAAQANRAAVPAPELGQQEAANAAAQAFGLREGQRPLRDAMYDATVARAAALDSARAGVRPTPQPIAAAGGRAEALGGADTALDNIPIVNDLFSNFQMPQNAAGLPAVRGALPDLPGRASGGNLPAATGALPEGFAPTVGPTQPPAPAAGSLGDVGLAPGTPPLPPPALMPAPPPALMPTPPPPSFPTGVATGLPMQPIRGQLDRTLLPGGATPLPKATVIKADQINPIPPAPVFTPRSPNPFPGETAYNAAPPLPVQPTGTGNPIVDQVLRNKQAADDYALYLQNPQAYRASLDAPAQFTRFGQYQAPRVPFFGEITPTHPSGLFPKG